VHLPAATAVMHLRRGIARRERAPQGGRRERAGVGVQSARPQRATPGVAARRVAARGRGRAWVALALLAFVLVGAGVIWRRAEGHAQANALLALEQQRLQLQSQRAQLRSDIRDLVSRSSLAAVVEKRLDMHVPNDTQLVILTRPRSQ
jgi:hypothetical protein